MGVCFASDAKKKLSIRNNMDNNIVNANNIVKKACKDRNIQKKYYNNGKIEYFGEMNQNGLREGVGIIYYESGFLYYKGTFVNNEIDGVECKVFFDGPCNYNE